MTRRAAPPEGCVDCEDPRGTAAAWAGILLLVLAAGAVVAVLRWVLW